MLTGDLLSRGKGLALLGAVAMLVLGPAAARGAVTAGENPSTIVVTGDGANDVTVMSDDGPNVRITNAAAGSGCTPSGADALCPRGGRSISGNLAGGNDSLTWLTQAPGAFSGGEGADVFRVAAAGGGIRQLFGDAGDDAFAIGASLGSDIVDGGDGTDLADYLERTAAQLGGSVTVDTDNSADDGGTSESDHIKGSIETVRGTRQGGDTLTAGTVDGDLGGDTLTAATIHYQLATPYERPAGASRPGGVEVDLATLQNSDGDSLDGGAVRTIVGTQFGDRLAGTDAANRLEGGAGDDVLEGRGAGDALVAGAGNDTLLAGDGVQDEVDCGDGTDGGAIDAADLLTACDGDGDRALEAADCNDADPAISPAAAEVPGNAVDENCDGIAAPFPLIAAKSAASFKVDGGSTEVRKLRVSKIPAGATVRVTCKLSKSKKKTRACPKSKTTTYAKETALAKFEQRFKNRKLPVGTTIEVKATAPSQIGRVVRYKTRKSKQPIRTVLCLPPGAKSPRAC